MPKASLARLLEDWFRDEVEASPSGDPRRTPLCLRFHEISAAVEEKGAMPPERAAHVKECRWCQDSLEAYRTAETAPEPSITISMGLEGQWPPELRDCLRRWLKKMARQEPGETPAPAHFDDEGTLHVRWRGLEVEGPVKVSLVWEGAELPLARGVVERGTLQIREPLPRLGVRNVDVSQRLLRVRPFDGPRVTPSEVEGRSEDGP
jgi:hypothetical protein